MKVLAVDDERIALDGLVAAIKKAEPEAEVYAFRKPLEALAFVKEHPVEVAFLDIQMRGMLGVDVAKQLKLLMPKVNIIFSTGYGEFRDVAFDIHASGYLTKPITPEKVRRELDELRYPVSVKQKHRIRFQTFGNFEAYADGKVFNFRYERTKEMLAYLVDRRGALCSNGELIAALWEDDAHESYLRSLKKDLLDALKEVKCADIINSQRGKIGINVEKVDCDLYDWEKGDLSAINSYRGEYMMQYSWGEFTNEALNKIAESVYTKEMTAVR